MHHSNNAKMGVSVIFLGNRVSIGTQFYFFLFFVFVFCWRDNSGRVRTHEKNSGDSVRRFGMIIQKFFCAQSGASIDLLVGNGLVSRYPGALLPALENFVRAFFPDPTDCPWIFEDGRPYVNYWVTRRTLIIWAWPKRLVLTQKCNRHAIRANVNKASKQAKRAECLPWNVLYKVRGILERKLC